MTSWPKECIHGNSVSGVCPQCREIGLGGKPCTFKIGKTTCGYGPNHEIHDHLSPKPFHEYQIDQYCDNCGKLLEFSAIEPLCEDCR